MRRLFAVMWPERERESVLAITTTHHCGVPGTQESIALERMDGPPKCWTETLLPALWIQFPKVCVCVRGWTGSDGLGQVQTDI